MTITLGKREREVKNSRDRDCHNSVGQQIEAKKALKKKEEGKEMDTEGAEDINLMFRRVEPEIYLVELMSKHT